MTLCSVKVLGLVDWSLKRIFMESPKLFISYSWEPEENKSWVKELATKLIEDGVDVILDQWDLKEGHNEFEFMQSMVSDDSISKVLLVLNKSYQEKADSYMGGVGKEAQVISPALFKSTRQSKYAAVVNERDSTGEGFVPVFYKGRIYFDMSDAKSYARDYQKLLEWAFDKEPENSKPPLGTPPWLRQINKKTDQNTEQVLLEANPNLESNSVIRFLKTITNFRPSITPKVNDHKIDKKSKFANDLKTYDAIDLPSVLGQSEEIFRRFLAYFDDEKDKPVENETKILMDALNYAFDSRFAMFFTSSSAVSSIIHEGLSLAEIEEWFRNDLQDLFRYNRPISLNTSPCNLRLVSKRPSLFLTITDDENKGGLFIYDPKTKDNTFTDDVGVLVNAIFEATTGFTNMGDVNRLKAVVFDRFKSTYGYVSDSMYETRYKLFKEEIKLVNLHFEPIVKFDSFLKTIDIWGVEALARKLGENSAPGELFAAAELWGVKFQTEVDIEIMKMALAKYKEHMNTVGAGNVYPLSINVYPNTILRDNYRFSLLHEMKKHKVNGENIILEISEKALIESGDNEKGSLEQFRRVQSELINTCNISFAMDDFGTGNSSISRVLKIKPKYVKIDRDILLDHQPDIAKQVISSVVALKESKLGTFAFEVIVEGLDKQTNQNISLNELINELKIKFIQGHMLSQATPIISQSFDNNIKKELYKILKWV